MLVQKHREYKKNASEGCFAVGKSREEIFKDLKYYCDHNVGKKIYYYEHPVRPNKENYRPEYMMEIEVVDDSCFGIMAWWKRVQ